jgi:RHS repeat-associated protein
MVPLGRRTEKTNQYGTTRYILAGGNVMSELDGSNGLLRRYVYGPGTDQPIAMINADGSREYYHYDGQGSVIATSSDNGVVVASYVYDAYGRTDDLTGNPYRYAGRHLDFETGFYYNRARYYSPQLGRFLSADPIGYGDGLNMYAYVGNNPMNFRDPSGLTRKSHEHFFEVYFSLCEYFSARFLIFGRVLQSGPGHNADFDHIAVF